MTVTCDQLSWTGLPYSLRFRLLFLVEFLVSLCVCACVCVCVHVCAWQGSPEKPNQQDVTHKINVKTELERD